MTVKPKKIKISPREKKKIRIRKKVAGTNAKPRLCVYKSTRHTYAQIVSDETNSVLASASTQQKEVVEKIKSIEVKDAPNSSRSCKGTAGAKAVGMVVAERYKNAGGLDVVFDRNGFLYHGRIKAVAEGAREGGLKF